MLFMLYLGLSIFALNAYMYDGRKFLYLLPFLHLLWANTHSSVVVMAVPFVAFLAGGYFQGFLSTRGFSNAPVPTSSQLKTVTIVFAASLALTFLNPYPGTQLLYGSDILGGDWYKSSILELLPPVGSARLLLIVLESLILLSFVLNWRRFSLVHALLLLPFLYLPFTAVRFFFLLGIVGGPVVARNLSGFAESRRWASAGRGRTATALSISAVTFLFALTFLPDTPLRPHPTRLGLGFDHTDMPEGAVSYLDRNAISGRILNPFDYGQYLIWTGYPERTVFVDSRGVINADLLEKADRFRSSRRELDSLARSYGFETILLSYPFTTYLVIPDDSGGPHGGGGTQVVYTPFMHPEWALVYWDDRFMLFLKRNGTYKHIVTRDEYHLVRPDRKPADIIQDIIQSEDPEAVARELRRAIRETGSSHAHTLLGILYHSKGRYRDAIEALSSVEAGVRIGSIDLQHVASSLMGESFEALGDIPNALASYGVAFGIREDADTAFNLGRLHLMQDGLDKARTYLERAVLLNPELAQAYQLLSTVYARMGMEDQADEARSTYRTLRPGPADEEYFQRGLAAYFRKDYARAIEEFNRSIEINPGSPVVYTNLGYAYYDSREPDRALSAFRAAMALDPDHANAHYGAALVHMLRGNRTSALEHFRRYLELQPAGSFAEKARRHVTTLSKR
jgi:tetratricopeptide (TPR) repeat protein